jgi:hypothetical protein
MKQIKKLFRLQFLFVVLLLSIQSCAPVTGNNLTETELIAVDRNVSRRVLEE